jgi:L-ascorbate metabolism protein UlaG (beta-lactamase superfamily)
MQNLFILSIGILCLSLTIPVSAVTVEWYGQSCFVITGKDGFRVVTDPYKPGGFDGAIGYKPITVSADVVTVSHEHLDHNYPQAISGNPTILRGSGIQTMKGIEFVGISSYHDKVFGTQRGKNTIFKFTLDGIIFCHLGDLGTTLSKSQIEQLGKINILMIPVGGTYTIDWQDAWKVIDQLKPNLVIPMHYKTDAIKFPLAEVKEFLSKGGKEKVDQTTISKLEISKDKLPKPTQIIVMQYFQ